MNEEATDFQPWSSEHRDLMDLARLAIIYGFPGYEMVRLRSQALSQPRSELNRLHHRRKLTTPENSRVTATNAEMVKSTAWLDLSKGPLVIHVPATADRYYSLALMDLFTNNFAVLGQRSTGLTAGDFLLVGPQWPGAGPDGLALIRSPSNAVWAVLRILVRGTDDLLAAHRLQDQFTITRSGPDTAGSPQSGEPMSVAPGLQALGNFEFFDGLNAALRENSAPARDRPILDRLKGIGIGPSRRFDPRRFAPPELDALRQGLAEGLKAIRSRTPLPTGPTHWPSDALLAQLRGAKDTSLVQMQGPRRPGWSQPSATVGNFGADYLSRARRALSGIGGLPQQDAMYFITSVDSTKARLGHRRYALRFPAQGLPPVDAYWSLTAYQVDENNRRWLVPNEIRRYSLGSHTPEVRYDPDGSLEILLQHDRPTGRENNWLPTPAGAFQLTLRTYLPRRELIDGRYVIPQVEPQASHRATAQNAMNISKPRAAAQASNRSLTELTDIARLAYIYGLPTYEVARLRYRALSLPRRTQPLRPNTFRHSKGVTTPKDGVVTAVNTDTLLSRAWLDLSQTPLVIHVPDSAERYYSLALMDFFTNNFAILGRRSSGAATGDFLLVGPQWTGAAIDDMTVVRAPTNAVWALLRILVYSATDALALDALQKQFTISPWNPAAAAGPPAFDPLSLAIPELNSSNFLRFFDVLNAVLTENPPPATDKPILDRLRIVGVGPSLRFDRRDFTARQLDALKQGLASAREMIRAQVAYRTNAHAQSGTPPWPSDVLLARLRGPTDISQEQNRGERRFGWSGPPVKAGNFGTDYVLRAQCALAGLGLLPREEAMYFSAARDSDKALLDGRQRYVLRFPPGGLPPVKAFWSLTIYQIDENERRWLVPNALNRYSIGNHSPVLRYGSGGSLEIFIQHDRPGVDEENWLPAPAGPFLLTLRTYLPGRELVEGRYTIPEVERRTSGK
jgi:hypothetical protein